jgi:signal recognition particle subunit SRP19
MGKKSAGRVQMKKVKDPSAALKSLANPFGSGAVDMFAQGLDEIKLPPKPDPSVSYPWPSFDYKVLQDCDRFFTVYPTYLDSLKTVKLGRRIPKEIAVDKPTVMEISEVLQSLRLRHVIEPHKGYSRDVESRWYNLGRVLVDKKQKGVIPLDERVVFRNKMELLKEIAKRIPTCPSRRRRLEEEKKARLNASTNSLNQPITDGSSITTSSTATLMQANKKKKGGKKGRQ